MARPTVEEAEQFKMNFGKHKGKTLLEIQNKDTQYIDWIWGHLQEKPPPEGHTSHEAYRHLSKFING